MPNRWSRLLGSIALIAAIVPAHAAVTRRAFGATEDGAAVEAITLTGARGISATILTYGATIQSLRAPDRAGHVASVVLGWRDLAGYLKNGGNLGATVGRVANRISDGSFTIDGRRYTLPSVNGRVVNIHGGPNGFDKRVWRVVSTGTDAVTLGLTSVNGDQGFPGTLEVRATFALDATGALSIDYRATTDKPTVVAMTNHSYFNLAGEGSAEGAMGNLMTISAQNYTPIGDSPLPIGTIAPVAGTPFDFRTAHAVGEHARDNDPQILVARGYDHNFVIDGPRGTLRRAVRLEDPRSGRMLELLTDQPGVQVYTANGLNGSQVGSSGRTYRQGDGVALEAQNFPNAVNTPGFPSPRLDPGQEYRARIVFRLSVAR